MRRATLLLIPLLLLLLLPPGVLADDSGETRRQIIYVPQDRMDVLIEKHGRGIVLTLDEYLELMRLAAAGRTEERGEPAANALVLTGRISAVIDGDTARLEAEYAVRLLEDGIRRVLLPTDGTAVVSATADGKPAMLARDAAGDYLLLSGKGEHSVSLTMTSRIQRKDETRWFVFGAPTSGDLTLTVEMPEGTKPAPGSVGGLYRVEGDGRRVVAQLPPGRVFTFAFVPRRDEGVRLPLVSARARLLHRVGPRLLRSVALTEISVFRRPIREIVMRVPAGVEVTEVAAPNLRGWSVEAAEGRQDVRLVFASPVEGAFAVALRMERGLDGPGEVALPAVHVPAADDERGLVAVAFDPGVEGRVIRSDGLSRVAVPMPPRRNERVKGKAQGAALPADRLDNLVLTGAAAAYRYWSRDRALAVRTSIPEARLDCDLTVGLSLLETERRLFVDFVYTPTGEPLYGVAPLLPKEYELLSVEVKAPVAHTWERRADGTLAVGFPSGVPVKRPVRISVTLRLADEEWRDESWMETALAIPLPRSNAGGRTGGSLAIFADEEFTVRDSDLEGMVHEPVERLGLERARLGYRWRGDQAAGKLTVIRRAPKVSVRHVAFVAPGENTARYTGFLHYTIQRAGIRTFRFAVPGDYGDRLKVFAPGSVEPSRRRAEGQDVWEVTLPKKVRGEVLLTLTMEEEMERVEGRRRFSFPEVTVLDVEDETGYLAVESGDNMEISVTAEGLREIGLEEMVTLGYRPARGLLAAYQYWTHPFSLTLSAVPFDEMPVAAAFIRRAYLSSVVARDGSVRTRATYTLLNTDRQFLRVRLPAGSALWGALVGGSPVKPSAGGGPILIPLGTTAGNRAVEVVLIYETTGDPLGSTGSLALEAPVLMEIGGAESQWDVWLPGNFRAAATEGVFGAAPPPLREPYAYRLFKNLRRIFGSTPVAGADMAVSRREDLRAPGNAEAEGPPLPESRPAPAAKPAAPGRAVTRELPEPVIKDAKTSDHNETDNDMPMEESLGEKDFISDAPFEGPSTNAAMGVGGGAGGRFPPRGAPPARLGRKGGLSLDVELLPGGYRKRVSALGAHGDMVLSYVRTDSRREAGYVISVITALVGLLLTGTIRAKKPAFRVPPFAFVAIVLGFATFAPAWFGARELTVWDAIARGTVWAALVMILVGAGRLVARRLPKGAAVAAAVLLAVVLAASGTARAGEPGDTVYVPYDPETMEGVEKPGRVFLPFEDYQKLWNAAHPDRKLTRPEDAPVPWLLTGAGYRGSVEGETAKIVATYDLVVLADGWVEVALPLAPSVVESALVDGEPVRVLAKEGRQVLMLAGKGGRSVELTLRVLVRKEGDRRRVALHLPRIPRTLLEFELPREDQEVEVDGPAAPEVRGKTVRVLLGSHGAINLTWRPKTEAPRIEARVEAETREVLGVEEGRAECRLRTEWRVVSGAVREIEYELDPAFELVSVTGADLKSWSVRNDRLVAVLGREVKDKTVVELHLAMVDGSRSRTVALPRTRPLGAVRERGLLGFALSPDLRVTVSGLSNLDRVSANPADFAGLLRNGVPLHSAYRFVLRPLALSATTEPVRAEVLATIPVTHLIEREWVRTQAVFTFDVRGDGTFEFPVTLPEDAELEAVEGAGLARWWRDGSTLMLSTTSPVRGRFSVNVRFRRPLGRDAVRVDLPAIHAANVTRESGTILVAHAPGLSLTLVSQDGLVPLAVGLLRGHGRLAGDQVNRFGFRQDGDAYTLAVARSFPRPVLRPIATTRLQVEGDRVVVNAHFAFRIENAGQDTFRVFFPEGEGAEPVLVADRQRSVNWADVTLDDGRKGRMLTIVLQQPVVGMYQFRLAYEKRLAMADGDVVRGEVTVRGPEPVGDSPASYVFLVNQSSGEVSFGAAEGLDGADAKLFPYLPPDLDRRLILSAWRGRKASWTLPVTLTIHSFADFPDAKISTAHLQAAIGRDGWSRNRMTYTVLNRTRQFLEISLPEGAALESVRVGGRSVKPGRRTVGGEERLLVPLSRMQVGDISTQVDIYWTRQVAERRGGRSIDRLGRLDLLEPEVHGFQVEQTFFTVSLPEGFSYDFDGNMRPILESTRQSWELSKATEELERLAQVQAAGGLVDQTRATEAIVRARRSMEQKKQQAVANLRRQVDLLEDSGKNFADLSKEQVAELRSQLEEQTERLRRLDQRLAQVDKQVAANVLITRPAGAEADEEQPIFKLEDLVKEGRELADEQMVANYRLKGKRNVAAQKWADNYSARPGAAKQPSPQQQQEAEKSKSRVAWKRALDEVQNAAVAQRDGVMLPRDQETGRPGLERQRNIGGGGGGGGGTVRLEAGAQTYVRGGITGGAYAPAPQDGGRRSAPRPEPEVKAGLVSLPVTVPMRGVVYRFEKRNGGARLDISAATPGTGRGLKGFGLFLVVAGVVGLFYKLRPDRRVPYFRPGLTAAIGFLFVLAAPGFPALAFLVIFAAVVWAALEFRARRKPAT